MSRDDRNRKDCEVAFIGRVTAGVSHEFMNVLATIRESSGLIEDLMALDDTPFSFRDKLDRTLATIRGQVDRGMEIGDRLNRFAHSMDCRLVRLEVSELLGRVGALMHRRAGMKGVEVKAEPAEALVEIEADPVGLQMVVGACIEYCLDRTASGGAVTLDCRRKDEGIVIGCRGTPGLPEDEEDGASTLPQAGYHDVLDLFRHALTTKDTMAGPDLELLLSLDSSGR